MVWLLSFLVVVVAGVLLPAQQEYCKEEGVVVCSVGSNRHCRIRNLIVDRSKLELTLPMNDYKPAGSMLDAFRVGCEPNGVFDFATPIVDSHGFSSDGRPFGAHFVLPSRTTELPQCDVTISETTIMFNRDWYRNVWHRVANDAFQAFLALKKFGLEERKDLRIVHLDFAEPSFVDLYTLFGSPVEWLKNWDTNKRIVCFSDVLFMVSSHWRTTFPEDGARRLAVNPWVAEFGAWLPLRAQLGHVTSLLSSTGQVTLTWVSRRPDQKGSRAILNEDEVIAHLRDVLGREVTIRKVLFEKMTIVEQMQIARSSDILFGMHGAGLTHILWLPPHAAVVEVLPVSFSYFFYERVAALAGIKYYGWQNHDPATTVECTWDPHTKFCNLILKAELITPFLERAVAFVKSGLKTRSAEL